VFLSGALLAFHGGRVLPRSLERTFATIDPTVFVAFPFAYELLVTHQREARLIPPRLRLAVSSAARLAPTVREAWLAVTRLPICDYYGVAEVGPCTFNDGSRPDSVGRPLPGVSFTITDEAGHELPAGEVGLIRIRTRSMASAYLDREEPAFSASLDEQGRYVTRDLGCVSATGHLILRGRQGRMVNVAGRKIDPLEVEGVLRQLPGVKDVLVCGEDSPDRTVLAAYIESDSLTREELLAFLTTRVAAYKIPQAVVIVPQLPRSSTGKVSVGRLRSAHDWRETCPSK
jgi:long-chain acyl-CoA synthetase